MTTVEATWVLHTGYDGPDAEAEDVMLALEDNQIWKSLPAVKEGRLRAFPPGIWTFGGPRSTQQVIAAYVDVLTS
jgi:iron complex transport system substrate-binding protein